ICLLDREGIKANPDGFPTVFDPATRTAGGELFMVPSDTSGKTLKKNPFGIYYEVHGKGPVKMVFLMGLAKLDGRLAASGREYFSHATNGNTDEFSYDQRGYGCSQVPMGGYRSSDMGHDLLRLLEHLKWTDKPLHLVGGEGSEPGGTIVRL
ncbi:hypothetical protein OC846_006202, partial [Tilletia horrida]